MRVSITDPGMTLVHDRSDYLRSGRYINPPASIRNYEKSIKNKF